MPSWCPRGKIGGRHRPGRDLDCDATRVASRSWCSAPLGAPTGRRRGTLRVGTARVGTARMVTVDVGRTSTARAWRCPTEASCRRAGSKSGFLDVPRRRSGRRTRSGHRCSVRSHAGSSTSSQGTCSQRPHTPQVQDSVPSPGPQPWIQARSPLGQSETSSSGRSVWQPAHQPVQCASTRWPAGRLPPAVPPTPVCLTLTSRSRAVPP